MAAANTAAMPRLDARFACLFASALSLVLASSADAQALAVTDGVTEAVTDDEDPSEIDRPELPPGIRPLIRATDGTPLVVVRVRTESSWSRGALRLRQREWPTVVERSVSRPALPADVRADLSRLWTLSNEHAVVCSARLGTPRVVRRVSTEQSIVWSGEEGGRRWSDREVARAAWDLAAGSELLVAPVIKLHGRCGGAQWATTEIPSFGGQPVGNESRVLAAFRALPAYVELASEWEGARAYDADPAALHWDDRSGGQLRRMVGFAVGTRRFTLVAAEGNDGCGEFVGNLWALFEHTGDRDEPGRETITLVASDRTYGYLPSALVDLDADGVPEMVGFQQFHALATGLSTDVTPLFLGCNC